MFCWCHGCSDPEHTFKYIQTPGKKKTNFQRIVSISWGTNSSRRIGRYFFLKFVVPQLVARHSLQRQPTFYGNERGGCRKRWRMETEEPTRLRQQFFFFTLFTCSQSPTLDWHVWTSFYFQLLRHKNSTCNQSPTLD